MNRLIRKPPSSVEIDGVNYPINTDFRVGLRTNMAIEDKELIQSEKVFILLHNLYGENSESWPPDIEQAIEKAIWFLSAGREKSKKKNPKLFDFDADAERINSAFQIQGVNLDEIDMHLWTFLTRLSELPESMFTRIVYLRNQHRLNKLSKEERKECDRIGWDVINMSNDTPDDDEIWRYLKGGE